VDAIEQKFVGGSWYMCHDEQERGSLAETSGPREAAMPVSAETHAERRRNDLGPVAEELLALMQAHREVTQETLTHRTTLEAYAAADLEARPHAAWIDGLLRGGLRARIAEALLSLRSASLVSLSDRGFALTSQGEARATALAKQDSDWFADLIDLVRLLRHQWSEGRDGSYPPPQDRAS
jgi:hypothetical protein